MWSGALTYPAPRRNVPVYMSELQLKHSGAQEGVHLLEQLQEALFLLDQRLALVWCKVYVIAAQQAVSHLVEVSLTDSAILFC